MDMDNSLIIFTHIPKCAGTSLRYSLINNNIDEKLIYRPNNGIRGIIGHKEDFAYLVGHWPYGTEKLISLSNPARKRKKIYITVLREPLDHMISFFYFQKQLGQKSLFKKNINDYNIVSFYQHNPIACNLQTKYIAGLLLERFFRYTFFRRGTYLQMLTAKHNLLHNFHFVCQFENLEQCLKKIATELSCNYTATYNQSTKTVDRPSIENLDKDTIALLKQYNELDFMLYEYALKEIWK